MPVSTARALTFTPEEYFDWEETQDVRHEYAAGKVHRLPAESSDHHLVVSNCIAFLGNEVDRSGRYVLSSGMRLQIHDARYVYADASVVFGPPALRDETRRVLLNPAVVVEVLSDRTAVYDRGEKFALYREVPSIHTVVWVDSTRRWAEVAAKTNGVWAVPAPVTGGAVRLPSLGVDLALDGLYHGVEV
ncbi:Uma2 family endonuclease [Rubrivirga sp. S365]|uniref:Uma2 family endonuclease n=1 Tax=Rubrivirga litoralis TaxID=3075598 RepID=A0ABU3BT68_9BACT|nr:MULTISPECIES: Uma2 family endonuclease [unclassified Rubrivirga]MDT0632479.1 Uma2 family endonuclease [Rubrivirga sp. F394]MDT7857979.1 Uma2 family endonuclease [Rubrivirga sp. S365]